MTSPSPLPPPVCPIRDGDALPNKHLRVCCEHRLRLEERSGRTARGLEVLRCPGRRAGGGLPRVKPHDVRSWEVVELRGDGVRDFATAAVEGGIVDAATPAVAAVERRIAAGLKLGARGSRPTPATGAGARRPPSSYVVTPPAPPAQPPYRRLLVSHRFAKPEIRERLLYLRLFVLNGKAGTRYRVDWVVFLELEARPVGSSLRRRPLQTLDSGTVFDGPDRAAAERELAAAIKDATSSKGWAPDTGRQRKNGPSLRFKALPHAAEVAGEMASRSTKPRKDKKK